MNDTAGDNSFEVKMETQLETQLPDSGAQIPGNIDQEQPSGMESQQFLPTDPTPATEPATNRASRGRGRPGFVDSAERWTQVVLKKMERSKRTGQACNRCKARKLRCDPAPEGCFHCYAVRQRCMVTDRTTGDTFERGECARLRAANNSLREQVMSLKQVVQSLEQDAEAMRAQLGYPMFSELPDPSILNDASLTAMELDLPAGVDDSALPLQHPDGFENFH